MGPQEVGREFGLMSRMVARALGPVLLWSTRREEKRLAAGQTYEPSTIIERRNWIVGETTALAGLSSSAEPPLTVPIEPSAS